jgi:hypothetical protein
MVYMPRYIMKIKIKLMLYVYVCYVFFQNGEHPNLYIKVMHMAFFYFIISECIKVYYVSTQASQKFETRNHQPTEMKPEKLK